MEDGMEWKKKNLSTPLSTGQYKHWQFHLLPRMNKGMHSGTASIGIDTFHHLIHNKFNKEVGKPAPH